MHLNKVNVKVVSGLLFEVGWEAMLKIVGIRGRRRDALENVR